MRLAILTTDTLHHQYFIQELRNKLSSSYEIVLIVIERRKYPWNENRWRYICNSAPNLVKGIFYNPYIQSRFLENSIHEFEKNHFFINSNKKFPDDVKLIEVFSVNDISVIDAFEKANPDLALVYGTGKILPEIFKWPRNGCINVHGGILPLYKGLDTNLWTAYLGNPQDMGVTLHEVSDAIDSGKIYLINKFDRIKGLDIVNLRYNTTLLCLNMVLYLLENYRSELIVKYPQEKTGSYYGPMPLLLKYKAATIIKEYFR